ncbi:MAG: hypothetical protein M3441_12975 [Chloroflexota bacterium]|nr:hypothetical protein [Chloroflexota bacterium]
MDLNNLMERLGVRIKSLLRTLLMVWVVLAILVVGESLQPLRDLDSYLQEQEALRNLLVGVTIAMAAAGALLLALSQFLPRPRLPHGMSAEESEALSPPGKYGETRGGSTGRWIRSFGAEASFANTKEAWRRGSWRHNRRWRVLFSMMLGAILTLFGTFSLLIVIGPPGVKFLLGLLLLYAVARTVWAMWRA